MCCTDAAGGRLAVKPPGTSSKGIDANCIIWFQGRSPTTILARAPQVLRQAEDFRKEFLRNRIANNYIWNSVGSRRTKHWIYLIAERAKTGWGKKGRGQLARMWRDGIRYTNGHGPYRLSALSIPYLKVQERRGLSEKDI